MVTREAIVAEIERVPEERLEELYRIIRAFEAERHGVDSDLSAMARLRQVKISASPDFATRARLYHVEQRNGE